MTDLSAIYAELATIGVAARIVEGQLRFRPAAALSEELMARIREHRDEITADLARAAQARPLLCIRCGRFHFVEPTVCHWCRPASQPTRCESPRLEHADDSAPATPRAPLYPGPEHRTCLACGGGLSRTDAPGSTCWTCRTLHAPEAPHG